jgi:hypothetical protein
MFALDWTHANRAGHGNHNMDRGLGPPVKDKAAAFARAAAWLCSFGMKGVSSAVEGGWIDSSIHASAGSGFTLAACLIENGQALKQALDAGWRADKPCLFAEASNGKGAAWLPYDALAYELTPGRIGKTESARRLLDMAARGIRMAEPNPLAETALHCAARDPSDPDWPNPMLEAILSTPGHVFALGPGGRTALHEARGAPNILALLRAGADPDARDARGAKAIDAVMALPEGPRAWSLYERGLLEARAPAARSEGRRRL